MLLPFGSYLNFYCRILWKWNLDLDVFNSLLFFIGFLFRELKLAQVILCGFWGWVVPEGIEFWRFEPMWRKEDYDALLQTIRKEDSERKLKFGFLCTGESFVTWMRTSSGWNCAEHNCVFRVITCLDRPAQGSQKNQGLFVEQELGLGEIGLFLSHMCTWAGWKNCRELLWYFSSSCFGVCVQFHGIEFQLSGSYLDGLSFIWRRQGLPVLLIENINPKFASVPTVWNHCDVRNYGIEYSHPFWIC